jgi:hypothetical protein
LIIEILNYPQVKTIPNDTCYQLAGDVLYPGIIANCLVTLLFYSIKESGNISGNPLFTSNKTVLCPVSNRVINRVSPAAVETVFHFLGIY